MKSRIYSSVAALLLATSSYADAQNLTTFRVVKANANLNIGEDVFMMAVPKQLGYFKEEGLNVELLPAQGGAQAGQIMITGGAEAASILAEAILKIRESNGDIVGFYTLKQNNGFSIGVLPGSPIKSLADLPGKKVGFGQAGAGSDQLLTRQLRNMGIQGNFNPISLGYGAQVATGVKSGQVDGLFFWDSLYAIMSNQGLKLNHIEVPIQDELAGFQLAFRSDYARKNADKIIGYCRAMSKAYQFALTNPKAAVELFYKEFPSTIPAGKDLGAAVTDGVVILQAWLKSATSKLPEGTAPGIEFKERWENSQKTYRDLGVLKGDSDVTKAYTTEYYDKCNNFDRAAIIAQANAMK